MISYTAGYKYQLKKDYQVEIDLYDHEVDSKFFTLYSTGLLVIRQGYAWDGPSGPTFDTKNFMRGSLVHDVGYQMMAEGLIRQSTRSHWDRLLYKICREDGMTRMRAWWVYKAVKEFGDGYGQSPKKVHVAPK